MRQVIAAYMVLCGRVVTQALGEKKRCAAAIQPVEQEIAIQGDLLGRLLKCRIEHDELCLLMAGAGRER